MCQENASHGHKELNGQSELRAHAKATYLLAERTQLFCINPVPYAFHVVPVGYNAVFHGILDLQQTPEFLCFSAYKDIPFESTRHDSSVLRPSDAVELENPVRNPGGGEGSYATKEEAGTHYEGKKHFG
jgi:hypothetical protein